MMTATTNALTYYSQIGAALFPIPADSKAPTGIIGSFKHDHSKDPKQWAAWSAENPGCNFGIVAFASDLIIVDIDTSGGPAGRAEAWALWCDLCAEWGVSVLAPHVQSARGGWHVYMTVPAGTDASALRQPDAVKSRINIRCVGYTVAAGSTFQGLPYALLSDAPPHPAPAALVEHCTRAAAPRTNVLPGTRDRNDVAALLTWLQEHDAFEAYEDWVGIGMALKLEYGDDGLDLWSLCHDATVDGDTENSKWQSFATDPTSQSVTLSTFLDRAHKMGWKGQVRRSTASMFDGVAAIAAAAGASLSGTQGVPMMAGQEELSRLALPILEDFLQATADSPTAPLARDYPVLPTVMEGHGLYRTMNDCLTRVAAMSEPDNKFKPARIIDVLVVLSVLHADVFEAVCRRLRTLGHTLPDRKVKLGAANLSEKIERITVTQDRWEYDMKGEPQSDNSDNVAVLLGILGLSIRWNAWLERMEVQGGIDADLRWSAWTYVDDVIVAKLRTRANRTKTRFRPGKDFLWEALLSIAHASTVDPVLEALSELESEWDGTPRLAGWLSETCGVVNDPYHRAVARNIIGGMIKRARHPGHKHDTMAVFFGFQGSGKSTMAEILALKKEWFTDTVLLGDASKELVLSLAGKLVVEIGEMGMRGSANPNHVKAMISRTVDAGRTAYARSVTERPRRNIFVGTTNDDEPLVDPTGNRRFLPVRVAKAVNLDWLRENIGQLLGEAAHQEARGESFDLPRDVWDVAAQHQNAARTESDMEMLFGTWFTAEGLSYITAEDVVYLCNLCGWRNGGASGGRSAVLKLLGFRNELTTLHGRRAKVWVRGPVERPADIPRLGARYVPEEQHGRPIVRTRVEVDLTNLAKTPGLPSPPSTGLPLPPY
jgi:hypothetical protein